MFVSTVRASTSSDRMAIAMSFAPFMFVFICVCVTAALPRSALARHCSCTRLLPTSSGLSSNAFGSCLCDTVPALVCECGEIPRFGRNISYEAQLDEIAYEVNVELSYDGKTYRMHHLSDSMHKNAQRCVDDSLAAIRICAKVQGLKWRGNHAMGRLLLGVGAVDNVEMAWFEVNDFDIDIRDLVSNCGATPTRGWAPSAWEERKCLRRLASLPDRLRRLQLADALLAHNGTKLGWCSDPDDVGRLKQRGFAVLRQVVSSEALAAVNVSAIRALRLGMWSHDANTRFGELSAGAPSVYRLGVSCHDMRSSDCSGTPEVELDAPDALPGLLEPLLTNVRARLALLAADGLVPTLAPVSGEFFSLQPHEPAARDASLHAARARDWHVDAGHMLWVMLERDPINTPHAGLVTAPTDAVHRLCALATAGELRQLYSEARGEGTRHAALLDRAGCQRLDLNPGDGVLLLRGAHHRTQDYGAARVALTIDIQAMAPKDDVFADAVEAPCWGVAVHHLASSYKVH